MIPILEKGTLNPRITEDPRLSRGQREALRKYAESDGHAGVLGLDAKLRPVVQATMSGPNRETKFAVGRNGGPMKVIEPLAEEWR